MAQKTTQKTKSKSKPKADTKKIMINSLVATLGNVSKSTEMAGISRQTHYNWIDADDEYRQEVENIQEVALDTVEAKLMELINNLNPAAIFFYLKCKGKKRGYIEKPTDGDFDQYSQIKVIEIAPQAVTMVRPERK